MNTYKDNKSRIEESREFGVTSELRKVIYQHHVENVKQKEREKQVLLDLWNMATKGRKVILTGTS